MSSNGHCHCQRVSLRIFSSGTKDRATPKVSWEKNKVKLVNNFNDMQVKEDQILVSK